MTYLPASRWWRSMYTQIPSFSLMCLIIHFMIAPSCNTLPCLSHHPPILSFSSHHPLLLPFLLPFSLTVFSHKDKDKGLGQVSPWGTKFTWGSSLSLNTQACMQQPSNQLCNHHSFTHAIIHSLIPLIHALPLLHPLVNDNSSLTYPSPFLFPFPLFFIF